MIRKDLVMSKFTVMIDTDNEAFSDAGGYEVSRLLSDIAEMVRFSERGRVKSQSIFDFNGNRVGQWKWEV